MIDLANTLSPLLEDRPDERPTLDELLRRGRRHRHRRVGLAAACILVAAAVTLAAATRWDPSSPTEELKTAGTPVAAPPKSPYQVIEVAAPITEGLSNRPDLHELLAPPHPDDAHPIGADEIYRENAVSGQGSAVLYFGRYSIDIPSTNDVPDFHDTPVWILVVDEVSGGPSGYCVVAPGTTAPATNGCREHHMVVIDPATGESRFTSSESSGPFHH